MSHRNALRKRIRSAFKKRSRRPTRQPYRFRSLLMEHLEERALLAAGDPDLTFGIDGRVTANLFEASAENGAADVVLQTDGKIVVVGNRDYSETGPTLTRYLEDGELDPTFGMQGRVSFASYMSAQAVAIQADGKIVIAGSDYNSGNGSDFALARFNSDGSLDVTFGTEGVATTDFGDNEYGQSIEIDSNGKLLVAGYSTQSSGNSDFAVARYNSDGSVDVTFGSDGLVTTDFGSSRDYGRSVAIDSSGKIVVAGGTTTTNDDFAVARYNSDGSLDTTFDEDGLVITDFASHYDYGYGVAVDSNDRVVVAGYSSGFGFALARYNSNGSLDDTFDGDGMVTTNIGPSGTYGYHVVIDSDERIVVSGYSFSGVTSTSFGLDFAVARYNSDGSPDMAFGTNGIVTTDFGTGLFEVSKSATFDPSGRLVVVGTISKALTGSDIAVVRYDEDGGLDHSFGDGGKVTTDFVGVGSEDYAADLVVVQPDNKLLSLTNSYDYSTYAYGDYASYSTLVRRNNDGTIDASFGNGGRVDLEFDSGAISWTSMALQNDGSIVLAGYSYLNSAQSNFALTRYNSHGSLDTTFGDGGLVTSDLGTGGDVGAQSLVIDHEGRVVVAGYAQNDGAGYDFALARYNSDGGLDMTFGTDGWTLTNFGSSTDYGNSVAIAPDGKVVVAGYSYSSGNADFALARYNGDGSLDMAFGTDGLVTTDFGAGGAYASDYGRRVAFDQDGKIIVAGDSYQSGAADFAVARYNADGSLDMTFDTDGLITTDFGAGDGNAYDYGYGLVIDGDGKIVVAGESYQSDSGSSFAIVRYNGDGSLDTTFDSDGLVTTSVGVGSYNAGYGLAIDGTGKLVVGGSVTRPITGDDVALVRYEPNGSLDSSFGAGGVVIENAGFLGTNDVGQGIAVDPSDGTLVVMGTVGSNYGALGSSYGTVVTITRFAPSGAFDATFGEQGNVVVDFGGYSSHGGAVTLQSDGQIVVAGSLLSFGGNMDFAVRQLAKDGSLDAAFGVAGTTLVDLGGDRESAAGAVVDVAGRIVVVGTSQQSTTGYDIAIMRLTPDGTLDDSFGESGSLLLDLGSLDDYAYDVALDSDGKIVVVGSVGARDGEDTGRDFFVARLNSDGSPDITFGDQGVAFADFESGEDFGRSLVVDKSGKIVAAGSSESQGFAIARFNADGTLDSDFGASGKLITDFGQGPGDAYDVLIDDVGRIVVAGATGSVTTSQWFDNAYGSYYGYSFEQRDFALARYDTAGTLDRSFGNDGKIVTDFGHGPDFAQGIVTDNVGNIVAVGSSQQRFNGFDIALARYLSDDVLRVVQQVPEGPALAPVDSLRITFSLPVNPDSFSLDDILSFSGPDGNIVATSFQWLDAKTVQISFAPQATLGEYELVIGTSIESTEGMLLNQDHDDIQGETPDDEYVASFRIVDEGPRVVSHSPTDVIIGTFSTVTLTFSEPMDESSFDPVSDVLSFSGPAGSVTVDEYSWLDAQNLEMAFSPQTAPGIYRLTVSAQILDLVGNGLDQDRDLIPGEASDDRYRADFQIDAPPRIVAQLPSGATQGPVDRLQLDFSEAMDQDSFTIVDDVVSFVGPNGPIALSGSSWLDANTLELVFASQSSLGRYELVLSPAIQDLAGITIDQDADGEPGESVEDRYSATFDLSAGPRVVGHSPSGQVTEPITEITLTFNEAIDASTFTASDVEIQGPSGAITITGAPEHVSGNTYRIRFPQQSGYGDYHVFVGPQIQNVGGQEMDQDWDGILGEAVEDRYDATFAIIDVIGPRGTSHSPSLPVQGPLTSVDITFNEAIDAASFDASDVTIAGPAGPIVASQVEQLSADEFRVHFPTQSAEGAYHFTIGPNIQDLAQNWMDQDEDGLKQEPTDQYQAVLMIDDTAPLVTANSLTSVQNTAVRSFEITFTEAIDETSFDPEAITVTGPTGIATATKVDVLDVDRFQISIAGTEADGTYHVSLTPTVTDLAGNLLQEPYEFDFVQQLPDLRVTIGDYPLECVPGQQIEIQWTVTNAGQGAAVGGWTDRVFFSSDDGGNDGVELVQLEFDQLLPPGESYTRVATVTVPAEASGERWVVVTADGLAALDEIDNTNNTTVLQPPLLITERPYPDLRVSELTAPSTLAAGELVKVSWTVQNSGSGATTAGSWFDALYLSSDAALDNSDVKLTKVKNLDFLAAGESYVQSIEVLVPDSTPRGTYFLIAATDTDNAVQEFDREGNNAAASDNAIDVVTPPPAFLTVTSIQVGSTLEPGVRPTFTWTITNTGGTTIDYGWSSGTGWDDALALSRDQVYQEDQDYWLGSHTYWQGLPLAPGESYTSTGTAENRVPAWEPGTYYLVVIPDTHFGAGSAFGQSVINRDYGVAEVQIAYTVPDLAPISITIPENATVGQPLNIGWSVKNAGEGQTRTNNWSDRIYLSTDGILDSEDMPLGTVPHNGTLTAGTNYSASTTFKLPGNLSTGTYHLILKTDDTATVAESDETNNLLVSSSTVTVNRVASDLQVTSAEAPAAGIAGQAITIDWTVLNSGGDPTAASTWTDAIYLSDSASFDPGKARVLKEFSHTGVLASQGTYSRSELVPLPQHMEGTFYLFLAVDSRKELFELDAEENNLQAIGTAIEIVDHQPDLRVASFLVPTTAIADHSIELEWQIENVGSGSGIPNWQDAVYLSKDDILGPEDGNPLVTLTRQAILAPNGTYSPIPSPVSIRLPDGIEGTYHIILATDSGNTLYEKGSEQNNIAIRTIEIEDLAADLQVVSATIPAAGQAGEFIAIDYTAINRGREDAIAPWKDAIYLSEDDHFDPTNDRLIGVLSHSTSVGIDQTYKPQMMPAYVRLPDRVEGVFHIFVDVDHSNSVPEKLGESNNAFLVPQPISIFLTPADLIVSRVQAPINATAGALVTVSWSVKNQGPQSTAESTWSDGVYLSTDTTFDPASDIELGTSAHVGKLMAGESYDVSAQFRVRQDIEGPYYVYVIADARRQVFENQLDENNVTAAPVALSVIGQHADLTVAAVNGPTSAVAGEPVAISWTITNTGVDATPGSTWSDSVYLSNDSVLDASDALLGTFPHNAQLPPNGSYTQSRGITIPAGTMGAYHVIVKTDSSTRNDVFEFQAENNNTSALDIEVSLAPPADLEVAEINAPISAWSGQDFHIEWTSVNSGGTPANSKEAGWYDSVYLSRDAYLDPTTDLHLGSVLHAGILQPDATYTGILDVRLPVGLSGPYYIFVFTDSTNRVAERGAEGNNFLLASPTLQINLTPPADLVPTRVAPPSTVIAGEPALWEYEVTNNGTLDAMGAWYDTLYLSADASWDVDDARVARVYHKGDLAHGEHYDQAVTAAVPAVLSGEYYLIVRTDILDQVRESAQDETNNAAASVEKVTVSYHELSAGGDPVTGQINTGERRYFEIPDVVADGNLVLNLNVASAEATSELYIRYGEPPTRSLYDVTAKDRTGTGQLAVIPTTQGGTYYVLVYGDHLPESSTDFSIEAYLADFAVYDTSYGRGGAAGNLTIEINGAGFDRSVTAQLDDGAGFQLNASEYYFVDGTKLYATFDLTKTAPGTYDVVVHNGDGAEVTVEQSLEVVEGGGGTNRPEINVPSLVRWGREFQFTVTWGNDGLNDALAPLLTVGGSQPFGFAPGDDESAGTSYTFLGTNTHGGPPGILRPGQRETVTFFSVADPDAGDFNFYVDRGCKDAQASFDWDSIRDQLSQLDLSSEEFDEAFARMREQVGNTCGDYLRMLSLRSSQLPSVRGSLVEVNELTHIEFDSVLEQVFPSISGTLQNSAGLLLTSSRFRIRATELNSNVSFFADSLGDGSFVIPKVTPGVYALSVEDLDVIDVTPAQVVIDHDGHARGVQITVSVGSQVEGTIFLDNAPLSGAKIALQGASKNYSAVSDANGHYDIRGVGEGVYEVVVMGSGGATTHLFNQRIDKSHQILSVSMRPGGLIEGNLHLPTGWVPDTPVFFRLLSADTAEPSDTVYGTIRQGSFSIPGLPQGIYDLEFSADGLQSSWVHNIEVSPGQSAAIDNVVLVPGATIRGQVIFDDATFIPQRAQVQLIQNEQLLTAAALHPDGSYEFSGLAVGTYAVRFSNAAFPFSETVTLDVAGNGLVTAQDIVIRAGSVVTGLVTDTHAQLLLGMPVTLIGDDSRQLTTVTNEAGRYVFANLPQQRYRVLVASDDPLSYQEVDAAVPGQTYSANLTASEASVISGRVTTADGVPVSGGIVRLYDDVNLVASAITSSEGQYWLRISTEANFTLVTLAGEGSFPVIHNVATKLNTSLVVDVIGGSDSLNLHIDSGGTPHTGGSVSLYQTTPSGRTLVASVELDGQDEVLFTGLVSDSYDIHIVTDDDRVGETSVIVDGATELVVTLDTAASIRGNVVDNAGKFIPGARVTVRADDGVNLNSVVSGDDGDFQIVGLTPGVYTVVVSRVGYTPKLISTLVDGLTSANIQLQPSTTRLHGRVNDTNGQAVANAVITLADASNVTLGSVVTRGDGVFEIDAPQVDGLQISVLSDGAHPVIVHPATLVVGVNELESVEITRFVATSKGDQLQRVAPQTTLQGFGDGTLAVSGISLPTWLTQLFVDYDRSEEHLDEGDVPPLPTGECGQRCSSKRSDVLTAIQYQDRKLEQVHNAEDVLDPTVWLAAAVIVRDLSVAVGTAATAALSIESLLALIPALEIAAPSASATQAIVLASSAMFESINSVILKLDEIPLAKTPEASYAKAAEAVGILANVHTFVNAKVEVILRSIGDNPPAAFDNFNAGLGIIQTVLYLMGGVQKAAQQVAQVTLDVAEAEEVFEREKLAYESAAHSARVYLFRYLGCLKQPCDPCDGPNPPANCDGHDDDGGGGGGGSHDPNDKLGPEGYDVFGFIKPNTVLAYTVRFENDAKATASAVLVTITDQLDSDDDWNTFQLGNMQFDDHVIEVPPGLTYFETRIDLRPEGNNLFVDIVGEFNSDTGLAQWSFTGVDPTTGELTDDPLAGFLPPNNPDIHDGEGYVQYSVYPKIDLETAAQITNVATIVFDWNEPIDTPLVTNTIDAGLPASAVDFLPNQVTEKVFQVSWAGTDDADGSGVRSYDIYVSVDGGSYQRWLSETTATSATFAGEFARSYAFYSVAHDNVGHVELPPLTPDAQTVTPAGTASIGDRVWLDIDADGLQDAGERGLADVIVDLFQKDGAAVGSVMTDAAGYYRFEDLDTTLQYYLVFASPAGYRFSPQNQSLDNSRDSDVDPETGQTDSFSVTPGEHVGWDAGLYEPVEIRGTLWYDANQDGNQDNIEPVLPGWTVFIDLNENGFLDDGEPSVVADENGTYQFAGLDPGAYSLREIMPSTWDQVYPGAIGASDEPQSRWALKFQDAGFLQAEGIDIQALANSVPVLVDWNNDGLEDLLVGETIGSYGKVRLYLNEGTAAQPQFGEVVYLQVDGADLVVPAAGSLGVFPRVVDWNNDARKDLLLGLNDGRVQVLVNVNTNETPEFQTGFYVEAGPLGTKSQIDVGSQATVEMADWNADGRLDLIVGAFDGQIRVFLNEGSPESPDYRNPWIVQDAMGNLSTPGGAASVAVADLDGDGRLDLVLGNSVGSLYLYRNVGSSEVPRFETGQLLKADGYDITLDTNSSRPWIDDLDGDGVTDLIVGGADGRIRVYMRDIDTDSASIYTTTSSPVDLFTPSLTDSLPLDAGAADLIGLKEFRSDARFADIDGRGLAVVVIDTGLDLDHPFFGSDQDGDGVSDRIVFQYDFADDDDDASDIVGHGSNVTSIIASSDPLHQGVAPGVDIIHLKIFSNDGYGQFADAERALQWVIQNAEAFHVAAVNLSFGDLGNWDEASRRFGIGDELAALAAMDVIVVASAGNSYATYSGTQGVAYPAADPNTIAVGAVWDGDHGGPWNFGSYGTDFTTTTDGIAVFSQRDGQLLDTFAPGAAILGADARGGTTTMTGTSQAAPFVTGVAVLAQQIAMGTLGRPLTQYEFRSLLHSTGQTIVDGDDENDSVPNTGLSFPRLDVLTLAGAIGQIDAANPTREADPAASDSSGNAGTLARTLTIPFTHRVQVVSGDVRTGVDFGNRLQNMPPDVDNQQYNVDENLNEGAEIGTVFATDPNFGDVLEFTILSCGDTCPVAILPGTGKLTVSDKSQFDYEVISHLEFTVAIKDSTGLTSEAEITINVNDVNDPPFAVYLSDNVAKERVAGATIGTLSAGDQDTGQTHTFSLVDDASLFEIVGDTLRLKADAYLDTSDGTTVDVGVMVHDSGTPAGTRLQTLAVSLLENSKPWQNPVQPLDVNGDGRVEPRDVLNIINELFQRVVIGSNGLLPRSRAAEGAGFYFDSNGDGYCAPLDALIVINFLNARAFGEGENVAALILSTDVKEPRGSDHSSQVRNNDKDETPRPLDSYFAELTRLECATPTHTRQLGESPIAEAWDEELESVVDGIASDVALGAILPC